MDGAKVIDDGLGALYLSPLNLESTPSVEVLALRTNRDCSALCCSSGLGELGCSILSNHKLFNFISLLPFSLCAAFLRLRRKHQTDELATNNNNNPTATPTNRAKLIFVVPSLFPSVGFASAVVTIVRFDGCVDFAVLELPTCKDAGKVISGGVGDVVGTVGDLVVGGFVGVGGFVVGKVVVGGFGVVDFFVGGVLGVVGAKKLKSFERISSNCPNVTLKSLLEVRFIALASVSILTSYFSARLVSLFVVIYLITSIQSCSTAR